MKFRNILGKREKVNIDTIQSDFVTLASHQLRTPLSAVKWYTEILLSERYGKLNAKQREYLEEMYRSNERAINLVNDLLDVSRIQEGQIHLEFRPTRVEKVIEEVIDNLETLIRVSKVIINFEIINGPLPEIETDQEKLKRIVVNLLSNSIKYTGAAGKVRLSVERKPNDLLISVEDSGVGISKADYSKIFKKFFRGDNVIKVTPDGTGLGLFIAKSLVEAMDGKIGFESLEGKGTRFFFTLPLTQ
ncbi:MAG: HAMP domain-containing sensor histidine kinase [Candidatus Doudnabacteria bacterium]|nr:HAMP domain-containing sensor histidine kinase [bacterium]MDZ4244044.1 HAMP domain-containing sensor histidine kinase [Candidatus Doudnabacteria bacterium]